MKKIDPNQSENIEEVTLYINRCVIDEINYFINDNSELQKDVKYVYSIGVPHRGKTRFMFKCGEALDVDRKLLTPFAMAAELMMASAMNLDDIVDESKSRYGQKPLYLEQGIEKAMTVSGYMYGLIISILKKYRPTSNPDLLLKYLKVESILFDYMRLGHDAEYQTAAPNFNYEIFTLNKKFPSACRGVSFSESLKTSGFQI